MNMQGFITITGHEFDPVRPDPEKIEPVEIAYCLSMMCQSSGHECGFVPLSALCLELSRIYYVENEGLALPALMSEAYKVYWGFGDPMSFAVEIGDFTNSIMGALRERVGRAIGERFGFDWSLTSHRTIQQARETYEAYGIDPTADLSDPKQMIDSLGSVDIKTRMVRFLERMNQLGIEADIQAWLKKRHELMSDRMERFIGFMNVELQQKSSFVGKDLK